MKYKIVGDSCCDFTAEDLKKEYISRVPLILTVGDTDVIDDDTFDQEKYLDTLTALENLFHEYQSSYVLVPTEQYVQMKDALAAATFSVENGEQTETPEPPVESGTVELSELQKQMQDILVDHYYIYSDFQVDENGNIRQDEQGNNLKLTDLLAEYKKDLNNEEIKKEILDTRVGEIEKMDIAEVRNIVDSDILQPIQNNTDTFIQNVSTQYAKEKEQLRTQGTVRHEKSADKAGESGRTKG